MTGELYTMTREEFYKIAKELWGDDPKDWIFVCPWCDNKQSFNSLMKILDTQGFIESMRYGKITKENIKDLQPKPDQECISPNCNYVSYGLIGGSLEIDDNRYLMLVNMEQKLNPLKQLDSGLADNQRIES